MHEVQMKPKLKLWFTDFWDVFNKQKNIFTHVLSKDYELIITDVNPDILIYSWEGREFEKYDCIRIYYTPENWLMPKYYECDFSLSFEYWDDSRNLRFPNYLLYEIHPEQLDKTKIDIEKILAQKTDFCSMVVSNPNTLQRNLFFEKLSKYKKVNSGGKYANNVGGRVKDKYEFVAKHKFNICFENAIHPGYTTEKIVQDMRCMTIPIYWGNPLIHYEFNTKSFFNYGEYKSEEELIEDIIKYDNDATLYYRKFIEPWFEDNVPNQFFDLQRLRMFFKGILDKRFNYMPIARNLLKGKIYYPVVLNTQRGLYRIKKLLK